MRRSVETFEIFLDRRINPSLRTSSPCSCSCSHPSHIWNKRGSNPRCTPVTTCMHEGIWQEKQLTWSDILQDLPELLLHFDAQLQRDSCVFNQARVINTVSKTHQRCSIFHLREFFMKANQYNNIGATACRARLGSSRNVQWSEEGATK